MLELGGGFTIAVKRKRLALFSLMFKVRGILLVVLIYCANCDFTVREEEVCSEKEVTFRSEDIKSLARAVVKTNKSYC